ncbi:hypothetical protein FSP39_017054 [Pinctada imbricata]|uniref:Uncharacterized protein n=1 Tax=Pinctada imbricata TaxID=66713 RepID=A0AA89BR86_PINIB|nr:hypothetical protein FSP39_017054 [Pinctada imbricata]
MPERSSGYTSSDSETSSYTGGRRVSTRTETLQSSKGGKITELKEGELESNIHVQHLAETISKLTGDNTEEYLPDINQTVTKIPGGNLVITTLTHKVVEEEEEDENKTKNGPDDDNSRYIVQDHTGQYYYVEDITDETQESAYYSSSGTQNSSYDGYGQNSRDFHGIQNLQAVGKSSIGYDTAEEVLLGLYNSPGTMEIHEYDEREYEERSGQCKGAVQPYGMTNNSSMNKQTTSYEYDNSIKRPVPHNIGSSTVKTMKHMYEMESSAPWVTDGTTSQQIQEGEAENEVKRESMQTTETHADQTGMNSMCAAYMLQSSASVIPPVPQPPVVPPPVIYPPVVPQYRVAKVDFTPAPILTSTPQVSESHTQTEVVEEKEVKHDRERPIFKTVALVKGPYEAPKWKQTKEREDDSIKYKVVNSRASEPLQEETVEYEENVKTMSTYKMEKTGFDENSNLTMPQYVNYPSEQQRYRTEKVFQINGTSPSPSTQKSFQTKINVGGSYRDIEAQRRPEHSHYEYIKETQRDGGYHANDEVDRPSDMRVVRGNILIKNTMDQDLEDYNDNINLFDRTFNMSKDNPLYQSDEDLYKRFEREQEMEKQRQRRLDDRLNQDITFETVDRFTKSKEVKRIQEKQRPKKNLSQLLLTRIASLDSKDIRQHIDVKHHNEDIFGDINLIHADGTRGRSTGTSNFDSVDENVDLVMKDGKAFITIKVTAERISPIDLEFNVWRKSQAIVTRVIEIDFFANEQRRRLYENVMDRAGGMDREYERLGTRRHGSHGYKARETVLSSQETLDLFSEIMEAADGEGDNEDITVKTSQRKTFLPKNSMDFLY